MSIPGENQNRGIAVGHLADAALGTVAYRGADQTPQAHLSATLLSTIVALILVIACVNLANLLLTRGVDREKEMSVRAELGATPARLMRLVLVESTVIAGLGGVLGLCLAAWTGDALWSLRPPQLEAGLIESSLDARVLGFSLALTLGTGVMFGLIPALAAASVRNLQRGLRAGGGRVTPNSPERRTLRSGLVAAEVALTFMSLLAAGLFVKSLQRSSDIETGFRPAGLVTFDVDLGLAGYDEERGREFHRQAIESLRQVSGVSGAAISQNAPVAVTPFRAVVPEGEADDPARFGPAVTVNAVSAGYFETLGIRLRSGRTIDLSDREDSRPVAAISQAMADRFWPNESAVGRRFRFSGTPAALRSRRHRGRRRGARDLRRIPAGCLFVPGTELGARSDHRRPRRALGRHCHLGEIPDSGARPRPGTNR